MPISPSSRSTLPPLSLGKTPQLPFFCSEDSRIESVAFSILNTERLPFTGVQSKKGAKQVHLEGDPFWIATAILKVNKQLLPIQEEAVGNHLDLEFFVDELTYLEQKVEWITLQEELKEIDIRRFLIGIPDQERTLILEGVITKIREYVVKLATQKQIPLFHAYKLLVTFFDKYDEDQIATFQRYKEFYPTANLEELRQSAPLSSFMLRNAILEASHRDGSGLESWQVFTKSGKPTTEYLWPFLEKSKNWIPEAQGVFAKYVEMVTFNARNLAKQTGSGTVVLLKGGFGAGKTTQANRLFGDSSGILSPDKGKRVVRRSMLQIPHAAAHIQGSQIVYALFDDLIKNVAGTVVYDSSLRDPKDLDRYIKKGEQVGKKVVVYDIARNDTARALSVLRRSIHGEDPRIEPEEIERGAIKDKMDRLECMKIVLNYSGLDSMTKPEYHFIGADSRGGDSKEVLVLFPGYEVQLPSRNESENEKQELQLAKERLALEGLNFNPETRLIESCVDEALLKTYFDQQFERSVGLLTEGLTSEEAHSSKEIFSQRLLLKSSEKILIDPDHLYEALDSSVKACIAKLSFLSAFTLLRQETREQFFITIQKKLELGEPITYEDLPLRTALMIHAKLQDQPKNWPT